LLLPLIHADVDLREVVAMGAGEDPNFSQFDCLLR
jgi:hypothetical protein